MALYTCQHPVTKSVSALIGTRDGEGGEVVHYFRLEKQPSRLHLLVKRRKLYRQEGEA